MNKIGKRLFSIFLSFMLIVNIFFSSFNTFNVNAFSLTDSVSQIAYYVLSSIGYCDIDLTSGSVSSNGSVITYVMDAVEAGINTGLIVSGNGEVVIQKAFWSALYSYLNGGITSDEAFVVSDFSGFDDYTRYTNSIYREILTYLGSGHYLPDSSLGDPIENPYVLSNYVRSGSFLIYSNSLYSSANNYYVYTISTIDISNLAFIMYSEGSNGITSGKLYDSNGSKLYGIKNSSNFRDDRRYNSVSNQFTVLSTYVVDGPDPFKNYKSSKPLIFATSISAGLQMYNFLNSTSGNRYINEFDSDTSVNEDVISENDWAAIYSALIESINNNSYEGMTSDDFNSMLANYVNTINSAVEQGFTNIQESISVTNDWLSKIYAELKEIKEMLGSGESSEVDLTETNEKLDTISTRLNSLIGLVGDIDLSETEDKLDIIISSLSDIINNRTEVDLTDTNTKLDSIISALQELIDYQTQVDLTDTNEKLDTLNEGIENVNNDLDDIIAYLETADGVDHEILEYLNNVVGLLSTDDTGYLARVYTLLSNLEDKIEDIHKSQSDSYNKIDDIEDYLRDIKNQLTVIQDELASINSVEDLKKYVSLRNIVEATVPNVVPLCYITGLYVLITALATDPVTPEYNIPFKVESQNMDFNVNLDFDFLDQVHNVWFAGECILFIIFLIFVTIKLLQFYIALFSK